MWLKLSNFYLYSGDLIGLPTDENHLNFRWAEPRCKVLFSVSRQGNGASCHFASDKAGMMKIRTAINEFCEFVFDIFPWCEMIIAKIKLQKVVNLVKRCGFEKLISANGLHVYIRRKLWEA